LGAAPDQTDPEIIEAGFWVEAFSRDFEAAASWLSSFQEPVIKTQTWYYPVALYSGHLRRWGGDRIGARQAYQEVLATVEAWVGRGMSRLRPALATAYAGLGEREAALAIIDTIVAERRSLPPDPYTLPVPFVEMAHVYALLDEPDAAVDVLADLMVMEYSRSLTSAALRLNPIWDPLREHSRFQTLLKKYR
jgi:serine/threonine-protein kinase